MTLYNLYALFIPNRSLSYDILINNGFTDNDLKHHIQNGRIEEKDGIYSLIDDISLFKYGMSLIHEKKVEEAFSCFIICHEINPENKEYSYRILFYYITMEDYDNALKCLNYIDQKNRNIYLYLLNMIIDLPEEYLDIASKLTKNDVVSKENNIDDLITILAYNKSYSKAIKELKISGRINSNDGIILNKLLFAAYMQDIKFKEFLLKLIQNEEYAEIISILEKRNKTTKLNQNEESILELSYVILNYEIKNELPSKINTSIKPSNVLEALKLNDYSLALEICTKFIQGRNIDPKKNHTYILLNKINNGLIKKEIKPDSSTILSNILFEISNDNKDNVLKLAQLYLTPNRLEDLEMIKYYINNFKLSTPDSFDFILSVLNKKFNIKFLEDKFANLLDNWHLNTAYRYLVLLINQGKEKDDIDKMFLQYISRKYLDNERQTEEDDIDYNSKMIDDILRYTIDSGYSIDEICKRLKLPNNIVNILLLTCAKRYYMQKEESKGNELLKIVERSKDKTEQVHQLLNKVRDRKKLYLGHGIEEKYKLPKTLKIR